MATERQEMMAKAEEMGLTFKKNISNDDLRDLVEYSVDDTAVDALAAELAKKAEADEKAKQEILDAKKAEASAKKAEKLSEGQVKAKARKEAMRLVRCIVTTMDKDKSELNGEIFSASNSFTGFVKKMVPFNQEWHVPSIILDVIQDKKMLATKVRKTPKGDIKENIEIPAYSINILPALTQQELDALKHETK